MEEIKKDQKIKIPRKRSRPATFKGVKQKIDYPRVNFALSVIALTVGALAFLKNGRTNKACSNCN